MSLQSLGEKEEGQSTVEYGLVLMLVSTALVAMLMLLKVSLDVYYGDLSEALKALF